MNYLDDERFIQLQQSSVSHPDYELVFPESGFNYLVNPYTGTEIPDDTMLYVYKETEFIPIGKLREIKSKSRNWDVIGIDSRNYGNIMTLHLYRNINKEKLNEISEEIDVSTDTKHIPGRKVLFSRDTKNLIESYLGGKRKHKTNRRKTKRRKMKHTKSRKMRK